MTGHSFRTLAPVPQPSTTHAPEIVEWHPGPQPKEKAAAAAGMKPERITANKIANVLMRCSSRGGIPVSRALFDTHAQFRIVDHDRASINRTSTNSANRPVAMIGTYGETIPVEGFMDR